MQKTLASSKKSLWNCLVEKIEQFQRGCEPDGFQSSLFQFALLKRIKSNKILSHSFDCIFFIIQHFEHHSIPTNDGHGPNF